MFAFDRGIVTLFKTAVRGEPQNSRLQILALRNEIRNIAGSIVWRIIYLHVVILNHLGVDHESNGPMDKNPSSNNALALKQTRAKMRRLQ